MESVWDLSAATCFRDGRYRWVPITAHQLLFHHDDSAVDDGLTAGVMRAFYLPRMRRYSTGIGGRESALG